MSESYKDKYNLGFEMSPEEFTDIVDAVCNKPKNYSPTGSFYESVAFLDAYAIGRVQPKFSSENAHSPFNNFLKWSLTNIGIDWRKPNDGWVAFRGNYNTDQEALDDFPKLFRKFLAFFFLPSKIR